MDGVGRVDGPDVLAAVGQILSADGGVLGAGFAIGDGVVVTCAHVLTGGGYGPGSRVRVAFPRVAGAPAVWGEVLVGSWRGPEDDDLAFVRLVETPAGVAGLALGPAAGCRGHPVRSFGFPAQGPPEGHFGTGVAGDLLPGERLLLQLTDANDLTVGFSGGPVVDEVRGLVVGVVNAIAALDEHGRGLGIAYAVPTEVLREAWPPLVVREVCPYRGLQPFTAEHAEWFHGRGTVVNDVLARLAGRRRALLVLGPSGSGKSSLLQAGVLPALADGRVPGSDRWLPVLARPGRDLLAELDTVGLPGAAEHGIAAAVGRRLAADAAHDRAVLVVDQFEELLATPPDSDQDQSDAHRAGLEQLTEVIEGTAPVAVVLVMRDDFYARLATLAPRLLNSPALATYNLPVALDSTDLRAIITAPAEAVGARYEDGLPDRIIADVVASGHDTAAGQAPVTILPLLELALTQLWERGGGGYLTHDGYRRIGHITGSVAGWCDTALAKLPATHLPVARRILTALVRPADEQLRIPAARHPVDLDVLRDLAADATRATTPHTVDEVLATLSRHRIITTHTADTGRGKPVAELVHDALIRDWGTLRDWVDQDHRFHHWLHRANDQHARWTRHPRGGNLLHGTDLAEGVAWSRQRRLPGHVRKLLRASTRRSRLITSVRVGSFMIAVAMAVFAGWQWQTATAAQRTALSRQLAAQSAALIDTDPDLASLLAVQAYRTSHTAEAVGSLYRAVALPLTHRLTGHDGAVTSVAFAPDGRTVATASLDGTARLWNAESGRTRVTLTGHGDPVTSAVFSPDGRTVATTSLGGTARLWDAATGRTRVTLTGHGGAVTSVVFSPDGRTLATASLDGTARLWDAATGRTRVTLTGHGDAVTSVAFSPDGRTLATTSLDGTARLWNAGTGVARAVLAGHHGPMNAVAYGPDGHTVAITSLDGTARLWDVPTGTPRATLTGNEGGAVTSVAFSPDGHTLATTSLAGAAGLWDARTGRPRAVLTGHRGTVTSMAFSPDGHTLATTGHDGTARLWDVSTGTPRTILTGHGGTVTRVVFGPDGRTLATGSLDGTARLWEVRSGAPRATLTSSGGGAVTSVAFGPDGRTLATASFDDTARLWNAETAMTRATLAGHTDAVTSVAFGPDGRTLATASRDGTARLWDVGTGRLRTSLAGGAGGSVTSVAFSPDGRTLATASLDGTARLWDVETGRTRVTAAGHGDAVTSVAFSPDGRTLATASADGSARLWDARTGRSRLTLTGGEGTAMTSVAFSPDGRTVATASDDDTARLWDTRTGTPRATLTGHNGPVRSVAFSPDGRTLATASDDDTARLWTITLPGPTASIEKICAAVGRDLTPQERLLYLPDQPHGTACRP